MATIEQIERHDALIRQSEAEAVRNLAAHLREAVINLPVESQLARAFVRRAKMFDGAARQYDIPLHGDGELWMLTRDVERITQEIPGGRRQDVLSAVAEVMRAGASQLAPGDPLAEALRQEAETIERGNA